MLYWTHSTVYNDCPAWSMESNQNKVNILLYRAAHGVLHQEAQVWSMASCAKHSTWSWTEMKWSPDFVWVQVHSPTHERDQVWSTASYCVQCAHAAWPWRQIKWEWKKILSCQVKATIFKVVSENFSSIYAGASLEATERKITHVWCTGFHCVQAECPARRMFTPPGWVQSDT